MKRVIYLLFAVAMMSTQVTIVSAQKVDKKHVKQVETFNELQSWVLGKTWAGKFNALPDVSTNLAEFRSQYNKNKEQWDAAFAWFATQDIQNIPAGKHPIEGTTLVASVEDSENQPLAKRGSESHDRHVDLMYVVRGTERFGLLDHASSKKTKSNPKGDFNGYEYDLSKTVFFDTTPHRFIAFFPSDWHIAKVVTDNEDQKIRVIVIKIDYIK